MGLLLIGHHDERPLPLERSLDSVFNLNINVLISTPDKRPPLLKDFSGAKGVASQEGFHNT